MMKIKILAFVFAVFLLAANLYMSIQLQSKMNQIQKNLMPKKSLPCESVPIRWAVTNYACANSLLLAMNVTNVKFNQPSTAHQLRNVQAR